MNNVIIGFSRPKRKYALGSWLIRLFQRTQYSHVYVKFHSKSLDRTLVYEAVGSGGVRFVGTEFWEKHAQEVESFDLPCAPENRVRILQHFIDTAGMEYGFWQNVGIVLANLFGWKKNPWKKGKNCSELVAEFLISEGYTINKCLDLVTPKDINDLLQYWDDYNLTT